MIVIFAGRSEDHDSSKAPVLTGATTNADGTVITLAFNKTMNNPFGKHAAFKYQINDGFTQAFSAAALNADPTKIDLTISGKPIARGERVTVSYTGVGITATDGGVLESFGNLPDDTARKPAPVVIGATTNAAGKIITIGFNRVMNNPAGKHDGFIYQINGGSAQSFSGATFNVDPTKFDLITAGMPIVYGDRITVSYTGTEITSSEGVVLKSFENWSVDNNIPRRVPTPSLSASTTESKNTSDGSLYKGQYQQIINGVLILFLIVNFMIISTLVSEQSQNNSLNTLNISATPGVTAAPSPKVSPTSTIPPPVKTTTAPTPKPTPTPVPPEKGNVNILYVYNKDFSNLWEPFYVNLVNPPLIIDFNIEPVNITDLIPYDYKVMSSYHHDVINITRPSDDSWFTVAVKYRNGEGIVEEEGYGGIYSQQTPKRLVIRTPGNYSIQAEGQYVNATLSMQVPKAGNLPA